MFFFLHGGKVRKKKSHIRIAAIFINNIIIHHCYYFMFKAVF